MPPGKLQSPLSCALPAWPCDIPRIYNRQVVDTHEGIHGRGGNGEALTVDADSTLPNKIFFTSGLRRRGARPREILLFDHTLQWLFVKPWWSWIAKPAAIPPQKPGAHTTNTGPAARKTHSSEHGLAECRR